MQKVVQISSELKANCPNLVSAVIQCEVKNSAFNPKIWELIETTILDVSADLKIEEVKNIPAIWATRDAYKKCGKDPNRYRPSAEQLNRRILQKKSLYQISSLVDLVNLISFKTGYSIGGFDADKIQGNLKYGIGCKDEKYKGIGRGFLNIEGLPVLRDDVGGVGTPTSDEERTMLSVDTTHFLMNINAFDGKSDTLEYAVNWSVELLLKYVEGQNINIAYFK